MQEAALHVDTERLTDAQYLEEVTYALLARCSRDADHVELRRVASRTFPALARSPNQRWLGRVIGRAATVRAANVPRVERDITDARLELTATEPLTYPGTYGDMDDAARATVIAFCEREVAAGRDGPEALTNLLRRYGWPYSERTFYVGPWKAARLRRRRRGLD